MAMCLFRPSGEFQPFETALPSPVAATSVTPTSSPVKSNVVSNVDLLFSLDTPSLVPTVSTSGSVAVTSGSVAVTAAFQAPMISTSQVSNLMDVGDMQQGFGQQPMQSFTVGLQPSQGFPAGTPGFTSWPQASQSFITGLQASQTFGVQGVTVVPQSFAAAPQTSLATHPVTSVPSLNTSNFPVPSKPANQSTPVSRVSIKIYFDSYCFV